MSSLEHMLVDTAGMKLVQQPAAVRRDPDREHVRRHPLRRRGRHVRRPLGPRHQRASATADRAFSSRCTAPLPTSQGRGLANPAAMLRSAGAAAPPCRRRAGTRSHPPALHPRCASTDPRWWRRPPPGPTARWPARRPPSSTASPVLAQLETAASRRCSRRPGVHARRMRGLVGRRPGPRARATGNVVEPVQQAVTLKGVEVERDLAARRVEDHLRSRSTSAGAHRRPRRSADGSRQARTIGTRPILKQFMAKMSPNDGAMTASKPSPRAPTRRARARSRSRSSRPRSGSWRRRQPGRSARSRARPAAPVEAPVEEEELAEAGTLDPLQELLRDDLIGIDVRAVETATGPLSL